VGMRTVSLRGNVSLCGYALFPAFTVPCAGIYALRLAARIGGGYPGGHRGFQSTK